MNSHKRLLKFVIVFIIFLVQLFFLLMIFNDHRGSYVLMLFLLLSILLLVLSYYFLPLHHAEFTADSKWTFVSLPIAALITYYLNMECGFGPVFSAGIVGTIGSYLNLFNRKSVVLKNLSAPIYCGAFIGMSTMNVAGIYLLILVASLFSATLFYYTKTMFVGIGGKLGTIAFIGVLIVMVILKLIAL